MTAAADRVAIYGTAEPPPALRLLVAGPLEAELQDGQLRAVRWHGVEVLRAIAFLVRDENWGTLAPRITEATIEPAPDGFVVRIRAQLEHDEARFAYAARITGTSHGALAFEASGSVTGATLRTNRTGFVVLHPAGVAGEPVAITHVDGSTTSTRFPDTIAPFQPATDIGALNWSPAPGLAARCVMQGDAFEMEDHRNWGDASFKTYVRPLARGFPYGIDLGETLVQAVRLTVEGHPARAPAAAATPRAATVIMPEIGLAMEADDAPATVAAAQRLRGLGVAYLTARFDPARHGKAEAAAIAAAARALDAWPEVELVLPAIDPVRELTAIAATFRAAGLTPSLLAPFPRRDYRTRPPGVPTGEAGIDAILAAARALFPGARLLAGSPALFTELNRNPPTGGFDLVGHAFSATIHAADDRSVLETLETIEAMSACAARMAPGRERRVGLAAIGLRDNPYGAIAANPTGVRRTTSAHDPRHGARFGAAFAVALVAAAARSGIGSVTPALTTGPLGLERDGRPTPLAAAVALLARRGGRTAHVVGDSDQGFVAIHCDGLPTLAASLSPAVIDVDQPNVRAVPPFGVQEV